MNGNVKWTLKKLGIEVGSILASAGVIIGILAALNFLPGDFVTAFEFEKYQKSHEAFVEVNIKRFEEKIDAQTKEIENLKQEIKELRSANLRMIEKFEKFNFEPNYQRRN